MVDIHIPRSPMVAGYCSLHSNINKGLWAFLRHRKKLHVIGSENNTLLVTELYIEKITIADTLKTLFWADTVSSKHSLLEGHFTC